MNKSSKNFITIIFISILSLLLIGCDEKPKNIFEKKTEIYQYFYPLEDTETIENIKVKTVYLPVYSHLSLDTNYNYNIAMGITLSIRNTDFNENLLIKEISYYNTKGDLVQTYIDKIHALKPMSSIDFIIELKDMRGGSGANFIIKYLTQDNISAPIIQAVMVNNSNNKSFAFITNGKIIHNQK